MPNGKRAPLPDVSDEEEAEIQRMIAEDPDDHEITDEQFAKRLTPDQVLPPDFLAAARARGARSDKVVTIHVDRDIVDAFKADGPDWEERVNDALRDAKKLPKRA